MNLIALFGILIVICLVCWAVPRLTAAFNVPAPISTVIYVILVVVCVLFLLSVIGALPSMGSVQMR